jgi:hypothetical protein
MDGLIGRVSGVVKVLEWRPGSRRGAWRTRLVGVALCVGLLAALMPLFLPAS